MYILLFCFIQSWRYSKQKDITNRMISDRVINHKFGSPFCAVCCADYVIQMSGFFYLIYRNELTRLNRVYVNNISAFHIRNVWARDACGLKNTLTYEYGKYPRSLLHLRDANKSPKKDSVTILVQDIWLSAIGQIRI